MQKEILIIVFSNQPRNFGHLFHQERILFKRDIVQKRILFKRGYCSKEDIVQKVYYLNGNISYTKYHSKTSLIWRCISDSRWSVLEYHKLVQVQDSVKSVYRNAGDFAVNPNEASLPAS